MHNLLSSCLCCKWANYSLLKIKIIYFELKILLTLYVFHSKKHLHNIKPNLSKTRKMADVTSLWKSIAKQREDISDYWVFLYFLYELRVIFVVEKVLICYWVKFGYLVYFVILWSYGWNGVGVVVLGIEFEFQINNNKYGAYLSKK